MNENVETPNVEKSTGGRPKYNDNQFEIWLTEMKPHLLLGCSLNRAMEKAGLLQHAFVIYEKYRLNDWFSQKIDGWRSTPGENANEAMTRMIEQIRLKIIQEKPLTQEEVKILTFFSERHRTAQPFFVNRVEQAKANDEDLGKVLDILESDYGEFDEEAGPSDASAEAEKQEVENDPPLQGEEQSGPTGDVQTEPDPAQAP